MISMLKVNSIHQMRREGRTVTNIANELGISRDTVRKYIAQEDFSPKPPLDKSKPRKLDAYRTIIEQWLDDDAREWRKQRHTAHRIWERLRDEYGLDVSESTVSRYVARLRKLRAPEGGFLQLEWEPAEAQADFGEADFYVWGERRRLPYFVLVFPFSNVGFCQVMPAENAECVCEALKSIFEYVGGVPLRIVFDNAAGVGRRSAGKVSTTELFGRFAAHYGFEFTFCNPYSGHEKGCVEAKVAALRKSLFVPVPRAFDMRSYNKRLLGKCTSLSDGKQHYRKGEPESQLFMSDRLAMMGLPAKEFACVRYERRKADKQGKVKLEGRHYYESAPEFAGQDMVVGIGAFEVTLSTGSGEHVCTHDRDYGDAPSSSSEPTRQLAALCFKVGAWRNSEVRHALPDDLRGHMDSLGRSDLSAELRAMRDVAGQSGWRAMVQAAGIAFESCGRLDAASMSTAAARINGGGIEYDEPVDLTVYDVAIKGAM